MERAAEGSFGDSHASCQGNVDEDFGKELNRTIRPCCPLCFFSAASAFSAFHSLVARPRDAVIVKECAFLHPLAAIVTVFLKNP